MKNPPHPGTGIKHDLEALGLTVSSAARRLGVSRQQLTSVMAGRSAISPEMAVRLEKGVGGSARLWLAMQAAHDLAQIQPDQLNVEPPPNIAAE
jgi:addiction module HigA family antidote